MNINKSINNSCKNIKSYGKELDSVFQANIITDQTSCDLPREFKIIQTEELFPGIYQPRKDFPEEELKLLAESMKEHGILQPIIVRWQEQGYEIIAGERRWRAAQLASLIEVPVIICNLDDRAALACGLIENLQRKNLNPIEEANAYLRLQKEFNQTHLQIAKMVGKSRAVISNSIRLLFLSPYVKSLLKSDSLSVGHARALLSLSHEEQDVLAQKIMNNNATVRATEDLVGLAKNFVIPIENQSYPFTRELSSRPQRSESGSKSEEEWTKILSNFFNIRAVVKLNVRGSAKITINVESISDFWASLKN